MKYEVHCITCLVVFRRARRVGPYDSKTC